LVLRDEFHYRWAFLGSRDDGKEHPSRRNPYWFAFAIQPQGKPLVMFGAGTGTASPVVRDDAAGLAVPRLIERDRATIRWRRDDPVSHRNILLAGSNNYFLDSGEREMTWAKSKNRRENPFAHRGNPNHMRKPAAA
jgi:hypothetical protein